MAQKQKVFKILIHVSAWLIFLGINLFAILTDLSTERIIQLIIIFTCSVFIFYVNFLVLMPKLALRSKWFLYIISMVLIISACTTGSFLRNKAYWENRAVERRAELRQTYGEDLNEKDFRFFSDAFIKRLIRQYTLRALYVFVSVLAVSFIIPFVMQWYDTEKRIAKHEKEKLDSELKYLKNQINPHFLFNSLNSIYALASRKSELTTEAVLKLSSILRYILYDSNTGIVSLGQEINHIEDYIALQKLRLTDKVNLSCTFEVSDKGKRIEPLLLMPLVENVFKYGVDNVNQSQIELLLKTEGDNLIFSTKNTLVILSDESKERDSGIGIKNVERRLELTYRDNATLKHGVENNMYSVELKINLAKHEMFSS